MIHYLNSLLSEHLAYAISWTVIHSLWQASLIALIMSWFLNRYKHEDAIIRYRISYAALLFVFFGAAITFVFYYCFNISGSDDIVTKSYVVSAAGLVAVESTSVFFQVGTWLGNNLDLLASMWVLGVMLFSVKLGGSYLFASQLKKRNTEFLPDNIYKGFIELKQKLGIRKYIHIAESKKVNTPMLIGYLKPVILFPVGLINQLTIEETQAILAHELAHIKRNDFIHNLMLSVVEMLFYYHPAVWWISANVRMERENCCDDLAMKLIGDKTIYAKTLLKIEELKTSHIPSLAIPLSRNKNQLLHRISRIVNQPQTRSQIRERFIATCLLFTFFFGFGHSAIDSKLDHIIMADPDRQIVTNIVKDCDKQSSSSLILNTSDKSNCDCGSADKRLVNVTVSHKSDTDREIIYIDTIPSGKKSSMTIINSGDDQEVILRMKDGKIVELTVDGEEIDEEDYDEHLSQNVDIEELVEEATEKAEEITRQLEKDEHGLFEKHFNHLEDIFEHDRLKLSDQFEFHFDENNKLKKQYEKSFDRDYSEKMKNHVKELNKYEFDFDGGKERLKELQDRLKSQQDFHFKFEDGLGFIDTIHLDHLKIDSLMENIHEFGNGIVEFDSSFPHHEKFHFDFPRHEEFVFPSKNPTDKLIQELSKDGFILENEDNSIELTGKHLKINGEKQPSNIFKKYKKLYEDAVGHALSKNSKISIHHESDGKNGLPMKRKIRI